MISPKIKSFTAKAIHSEVGAIDTAPFAMIAIGFILIVFAVTMLSVVFSSVSTAGSSALIGSWAGVSSLLNLIPFVVTAAVLLLGVGLMAIGGYRVWKQHEG